MLRLLLLAAILATASSCDSAGPTFTGMDGLAQDAALLVGTWEWERSFSCGDGSGGCQEFVPAPTATETLTFTADGQVSGYFNESDLGPLRYRLDEFDLGSLRYRVERSDVVAFDAADRVYRSAWFGVSRDRLVLSTAAMDGSETTYRRRR